MGRLDSLAKLVETRTGLRTLDPFGAVEKAWIRVEGLTRKWRLRLESDWKSGEWIRVGKRIMTLDPKPPVCCTHDSDKGDGSVEVVLLLTGKIRLHRKWVGLMLVQSRKQQGAFDRIGYFETESVPPGEIDEKSGYYHMIAHHPLHLLPIASLSMYCRWMKSHVASQRSSPTTRPNTQFDVVTV